MREWYVISHYITKFVCIPAICRFINMLSTICLAHFGEKLIIVHATDSSLNLNYIIIALLNGSISQFLFIHQLNFAHLAPVSRKPQKVFRPEKPTLKIRS